MRYKICAVLLVVVALLIAAASLPMFSTKDRPETFTKKLGSPTAHPLNPPVQNTTAAGPNEPVAGFACFEDVSEKLGVDFLYYNDHQARRFFNGETNGGGVAWIDYDLDDWPDLYFTNGRVLVESDASNSQVHRNWLGRNLFGGRFEVVTERSRTDDVQFGHGVAVGDFDNDGWPDLFVCNFGPNVLFRNNGDGTFSDVSADCHILEKQWSSSAAFGDLDRDGDLELYVTTYAKADLDRLPVCMGPGYQVYCSPEDYEKDVDVCYINTGDGGFTRAPAEAGFGDADGHGMGVVVADLDGDAWPDIFVANDKTPSYLFHNQTPALAGPPRFKEIGVEAGLAFDGQGNLVAGMGIACGDADRDGLLDLFVTHYHREADTFYKNRGQLIFTDDTARVGLGSASLPFLGFGTTFLDADNDGWLDLFVANGHVLGSEHWLEAMEPNLYRNKGAGCFVEASAGAGPHFRKKFTGRGVASADFDRDGAMDLAATNNHEPATVLRNCTATKGDSISLELIGVISARSAANARVFVRHQETTTLFELFGGGSYQSACEQRLLIGLGKSGENVSLEIRWPSGKVDQIADVQPGRSMLVVEGRGEEPAKVVR